MFELHLLERYLETAVKTSQNPTKYLGALEQYAQCYNMV